MSVEPNEVLASDIRLTENFRISQEVINQLTNIDAKHHWMLAHSSLIQDVYILGKHPSCGPRGRIIRRAFGWLRFSWLGLFLLRAVGAIGVFQWWWKAGSGNSLPENSIRLFVGFGAGQEEQMWRKFLAEDKLPAVRLDQTNPATFGALHRPRLMRLLATAWKKTGTAYHFIANSNNKWIVANRLDFLTFACMRVGQYVFFLEWWRNMNTKRIAKAVFVSNDTPAFACLDSGFREVEFRQHGCLRRSDLMPKFPALQIMTEEEEAYLKHLLPGSAFCLAQPEVQITGHNRLLLVASIYDGDYHHKVAELQKLKEVFYWAESHGLSIMVRPHPCEDPGFWRLHFPSAAIDASDASFEDALLRLRPIIVLSWFSTALIDALLRGVVPVSISSANCQHVQDMIFPLHRHCLRWPEQKQVLDGLAGGRVEVDEIISELRAVRSDAHYAFQDDSVKGWGRHPNQHYYRGQS